MIVRSFGNNFEVSDYTAEVVAIPNQWGTINELGIFSPEPVAEHSVVFEEIKKDGELIVDRVRGERAKHNGDYTRKLHSFAVPHFPYDDAIYPQDIQGKRAYGSATDAETLDAVRMRKLERIRQNHAWTLEAARFQALTAGTAYAPNGTVSQNWFTEFGVTQTAVDFALDVDTTDVMGKIETVIGSIQDNAGKISMSGVVMLCSPEYFSKLIAHSAVQQAYKYYASTQEPQRQRLAAGGSAVPLRREFFFGGIRFIECRDSFNGTRMIAADKAVAVPTGTDFFKTYFSPANKFGLVNTLGEEVYVFESSAPNGSEITLESEANHISALLKPAVVIDVTA